MNKLELETQKYLRSGKKLEDLLNEYNLLSSFDPELPLVCLNYSQIASNLNEKIPCECRALILEFDTWNVVSRSFEKFFNETQSHGVAVLEKFDWDSMRAYKKYDGSLIAFYNYNNQWRWATRGTTNAAGRVWDEEITFSELVKDTMGQMGFRPEEKLDPDKFYSFELCTPLNSPVIPEGDILIWLACWDKKTLAEISLADCDEIGILKAETYSFKNFDHLMNTIKPQMLHYGEGVVIVDKYFNRVKIKSRKYLDAHRIVSSVNASMGNKLEVLKSRNYDDVIGILPASVRVEMEKLEWQLLALMSSVTKTYDEIKHLETQKDFALEAVKYPFKSWLFELRKGKTIDEIVQATSVEHLEGMMLNDVERVV